MSQLYEEAISAQEEGHVDHAEQLFLKAIVHAQNSHDIEKQQRCFVQLSAIAREKNDFHAVLRWLKKNYNLTKKHNTKQASRICLELGVVLLDRLEFDEAKMWAKKALDRSEEDWDRKVMAEAQLLLGMVLFREDRPEDARILFRRANVIFEELKDEEGVYKSLFHMGLVCHQMADFPRARTIFLNCLEQAPEEAVPLIADLHLRLTVISLELDLYIDALFHALASLGRYRRLQSDRQDRVWKEVFRIRAFLSEEEFVEQVKSHLNEEGYLKFKAMAEAVEMRFQKEIEEAEEKAKREEEAKKQALKAQKLEKERREAEEPTTPITRTHSTAYVAQKSYSHSTETSKTSIETNSHESVQPKVASSQQPLEPQVVELEVFEQEVQEDSTDAELTWREEPLSMEADNQTRTIVILFFGVFFFVFFSLYFLKLIQ